MSKLDEAKSSIWDIRLVTGRDSIGTISVCNNSGLSKFTFNNKAEVNDHGNK